MKTSRELRCEPQYWEIDENKKNNVLKFKNGYLTKNIQVSENKLVFNFKEENCGGCYPDDALALIRDIYLSFALDEKTKQAVEHIQKAIELMDQRALEKHGYSDSKEEQDFKPTYLKE